jgi:thiol-disulfide isomerase/thioredoxin
MNQVFKKISLCVALLLYCLARVTAQDIPLISGEDITRWKNNTSDTVYVVNFWATWCKPCVEELPYFEQLQEQYKDRKLKVLLVSNDFKKQVDTRLRPFIKKHKLKSRVLLMGESNPNNWIDKADPSWSGAIPATLIICGQKKFLHFREGETTFEELEKIIKPLIEP